MTTELCLNRNCGSKDLLEALLAYILISLDKKSGIKPVEIGEAIRKIVVKFITSIIVVW